MHQTTEEFIAGLDQSLERAACDLVLTPHDDERVVRDRLARVAADLAASALPGTDALVRLARDSAGAEPEHLMIALARLEAGWNGWKAAQVAATSGPVDEGAITLPPLVSPQAIPTA